MFMVIERRCVMARLRNREKKQQRAPAFVQCPGCVYNFVTGEGARRCSWYDCPYLPEEYKVFCPACNYNFATGEGGPECSDPPTCEWSIQGYRHADLAKQRFVQAG
jgi:hypothetical protein